MIAGQRALEPIFDFSLVSAGVLLHQGQSEFRINGDPYVGEGEVRLQFLPRAGVYFHGKYQDVDPKHGMMLMVDNKTSFSMDGFRVAGFGVGFNYSLLSGDLTVTWRPSSEPVISIGDESTEMRRVVFHLVNFVGFRGTQRLSCSDGSSDLVQLAYGGWRITITSLPTTSNSFKALDAEGGYQLTHVGCLEKEGDEAFSGEMAHELLTALGRFLSFARGAWCEPICAVGFDVSDNRVWEAWSSPREPWYKSLSWFDPHHCQQLTALFSGFMTKWAEDGWHEALREVLYWYLNSNHSSRGIDAGIILTQAAIERLSYEYAVNDRRLVDKDGFKNLRASDKYRLLFSSLDIPIDIPHSLPNTNQLAKLFNWQDSPHALTEVRNSLVHPEHRRRGQFAATYAESWNLGLWYLELAILRICGYCGTYSNRINSQRWAGQVEDVPWLR